MRSTIAVVGLAAVVSATTYTTTSTEDVTVTSCSPTHTGNCPYKPESGHWEDWTTSKDPSEETTTTTSSHTWEDWTTTSKDPSEETTTTTSSHTWGDWTTSSDPSEVTTTSSYTWADWTTTSSSPAEETTGCGEFTATAPPAWFSYLPSDVKSSIEAKWTGAPPADWCYYTYSTSTLEATTTPAYPVSPEQSTPAAAGTGVWEYSGSPVSPDVAEYTGAASSNAVSFVAVALAGVAALL